MADHRSRRQKLEAVIAPGSGATDGERANARSLLAKMKPEPRPVDRGASPFPFTASASSNSTTTWQRADINRLWETLRRQVAWDDEDLIRAATQHKPKINCFGIHDWVVIGTSMFHTEIRRCTTCGEFDPPRRKTDGP